MIKFKNERLYEVVEVARLLAVTPQHVYQLCTKGRLGRRIGGDGRIRIGESDLEQFFGESRKGNKPTGNNRKGSHRKAVEELKKKGL